MPWVRLLIASTTRIAIAAALVLVPVAARADDPALIDALTATDVLSPAHTTVVVPVKLTRVDVTPLMAFSVTLTIAGDVELASGSAGVALGGYLAASGATASLLVTDLGGGQWKVDATTLGTPCGSAALTGSLFDLSLAATATSGSGSVTVTQVTLRDCNNLPLPSTIGSAASASLDFDPPTVTLGAPNGGETWIATTNHDITWTASDPAGVSAIDLNYSLDGGSTYPFSIATGLANTGTRAWTLPVVSSTQVRVRVTAHDALGNVTSDASDANLRIRGWNIDASATGAGNVSPAGITEVANGGSLTLTMTADPGNHVGDVLVDAVSVGSVGTHDFTGVNADHVLVASFVANPAVGALTDVAASAVRSGNDTDGTMRVAVTWSGAPGGSTVDVWRAGFGNYPRYGSGPSPGQVPVVPSFPPPSPWVLTGVHNPGETDETAGRDFTYFVAFVVDSFGTRSAVSNLSNGVLNYALGDVFDGTTEGSGNNVVNLSDISLLGFHYGLSGAAAAPFAYLDIGPTTNSSALSRPIPDGVIDFEDFVFFGMNYQLTSRPFGARPAGSATAARTLRLERIEAGDVLRVRVWASDGRGVAAASLGLEWNHRELEPISALPGPVPMSRNVLAMSPSPGAIDLYAGEGLTEDARGELLLASFSFRRHGSSGADVRLARAEFRDADNGRVPLLSPVPTELVPALTALAAPSPNPSRGGAVFDFSLAQAGLIELSLHGVDGRRVCTLSRGVREAGAHTEVWDGTSAAGRAVAPGVYYLMLKSTEGTFTRRVVRIR